MLKKEDCLKVVRSFRAKHGFEATDENTIATIHLMNSHGIDANAALDQSSRSSSDHGIDAWYYGETNCQLFIYQSKLTESKALTLKGLNDLDFARKWIEQIVIDDTVETIPSENHCLWNLYTRVSQVRHTLKEIHFVLLSLFDKNDLEDAGEYQEFEKALIKSELNSFVRESLRGKLIVDATHYDLQGGVPREIKTYPINRIPNAQVELRRNAHLDLAYVTLYSLIELYRQRGNVLFDKNVRLSLINSKEARERLVTPMDNTLDLITSGKVSPNIFPFYHIGVTISAASSTNDDANLLNLEGPTIINGCQTITIANEYLKKLEKQKDEDALAKFRQIQVIAKIVVGTTNEELKEITNSNNRQNPIENWQLFSNEPIHIEIEASLKDIGVFYERQKGKFASLLKNVDSAKYYYNTNGTFVEVVDLGQIIALSRHNLQWAAKPSEVFLNKDNHDTIFDHSIPSYPRDIVFVSNLFKSMKRGLNTYLDLPTHASSNAPAIFKKPIVRAHTYYLALLYFYQSPNKRFVRSSFSTSLTKIASTKLVDELQSSFYPKVVTRIKNWYTEESKNLESEVSKKKMENFFSTMAIELGIDTVEGAVPFSAKSIDWTEYS